MSVRLPEPFLSRMRKLLGGEYDAWLASYAAPRHYGLRVNTLKLDGEAYVRLSPSGGRLRSVPWAEAGYYYAEEIRPGKHPHYYAGLYYIQEPSAMAPAELLDVRPGHKVLDLCAAPGGKSTQIAAKLRGEGLLVANDIARSRTMALVRNLERAGVRNAVVLNEEPERLVPLFRSYFDRILVDAPCSGEGMFRKDESMIAAWLSHPPAHWAQMQRELLRHAADMLAPGGMLVYSTCTFAPEENEEVIAWLLAGRPDLAIVPTEPRFGWTAGRPDWVSLHDIEPRHVEAVAGTIRLWPHRTEGEGHYAAVLRRADDGAEHAAGPLQRERAAITDASGAERRRRGKGDDAPRAALQSGPRERHRSRHAVRMEKGGPRRRPERAMPAVKEAEPVWRAFREAWLPGRSGPSGKLIVAGEQVYAQPDDLPDLTGLRVVRSGWHLGDMKRGRFVPSQALALGIDAEEARMRIEYGSHEAEAMKYLKGETLPLDEGRLVHRHGAAAGYVLVCIDGFPAGWGKLRDGLLINELPPGWRWI